MVAIMVKNGTLTPHRPVAQPGSALSWGVRGRWFKSSQADQKSEQDYLRSFNCQLVS